MTADSAELHPVEGASYQAASAASADPLEAADTVEILRAVLPPDSTMRAQAIASSLVALIQQRFLFCLQPIRVCCQNAQFCYSLSS